MMVNARKRDTHQKIQLGGLIVKAGLREANKAVILGALIELARKIEEESPQVEVYKAAGDLAFSDDKEDEL